MNLSPVHLYLHIPYCHQACHYCDFHFSTKMDGKAAMVDAMIQEISLRKDYLGGPKLNTIYLGGGTPSTLSENEISRLFEAIHQHFEVNPDAEITLEANPEDLTRDYLTHLKELGVNRLSIGIQSFDDENLRYLNRNHDAKQSLQAIRDAQEIGISNISIDIIYGIPGNELILLKSDLNQAIATGAQHISAYSLTIEPKTVFGHRLKKGEIQEIPEQNMASCFEFTHEYLEKNGYIAYETSNFSKPGFESKHNSSYWRQESYLGIGPAAHSFNQVSRQWNVANNAKYTKQINAGIIPSEVESLSPENQINEYIMTQLRTHWGVDLSYLIEKFQAIQVPFPENEIQDWVKKGLAEIRNGQLVLVGKGKLIADGLAAQLFII
ncbi:radical SAM family heme chaperone HemW [Aquirufa sp. 5-AUSEE-100C1]